MSKITFRADDDLVRRLEEFDASKSEVMREALRSYLDRAERDADDDGGPDGSLDAAVSERIDELIADRLDAHLDRRRRQDVNVNVTLDAPAASGVAGQSQREAEQRRVDDGGRKTPVARDDDGSADAERSCEKCGETISSEHVYCPNCGEKASHRLFCECGDEIRSDWAFCPSCGRRTAAADVLDRS